MEAYKLFVRKNREFVHSLESLANGITWLLPERFSNSEIGPEAVYALLGILSTLNQHIIDTTPTKLRPPSLGDSAFPWSLSVSMLKDAETVVEVAAEHFVGEKHKWNYLALTEAVKAFVRLAAFRDSGFKILLQGGEIVNNDERVSENYNTRLGDARMAGGSNMPGSIHERYGTIQQNLEGRAISALSCFGENAKKLSDQVWLNKLRHSSQTAVAKQTLSTLWFQKGLSGQLYLSGEVLFILRPLIYVLFIRRCGIRSWKPWLISLAIDLTGMSFLSFSTNSQPRNGDNYYHLSSSEKDEMKRRKLVWALYIMRDPFFSKYTKHRLEKTDKYFSQVPLIGFLTAKLVELIVGAQTRYTYTSAS
ncbi:peroxisome biogenesis protein 16-like [Zingiber officinale]|uniref:peroxisome biogenesis protein 16-like n=1 Tax=Zingiber officinale TaxID=94328 RepID=UPI001C4B60A4|nr:peroxisome biogenesis protein 16-like [Zingiber officinale]